MYSLRYPVNRIYIVQFPFIQRFGLKNPVAKMINPKRMVIQALSSLKWLIPTPIKINPNDQRNMLLNHTTNLSLFVSVFFIIAKVIKLPEGNM